MHEYIWQSLVLASSQQQAPLHRSSTFTRDIQVPPRSRSQSLKRSGALTVGRSSEALLACSTAQPLLHARCEKHLVCLRSTPGTSKAVTRIYWDLDNLKPLPGPQGLGTLTALKACPSMALSMCSALMPSIPWHHESAWGLLLRIYRGAFIWRHMCACRNV